ncbi:MAG: hypothetical protein RMY62_006075 [Nostoc sp. ZfuVER08]|nr:hypothetical protein [Nostoc sp. ZfuVER08]
MPEKLKIGRLNLSIRAIDKKLRVNLPDFGSLCILTNEITGLSADLFNKEP